MTIVMMIQILEFYSKWQRMFQDGAGGNKVHLILRVKKHLTDEELYNLMEQARK